MSQEQPPTKTPTQPLHPSIIPKLDPEYIAYHNEFVQYLPLIHTVPWDPSFRVDAPLPGVTAPLEVGKVQDYDLTHTSFRTFTPPGEKPELGWPLFIYFHGGGWTFGGINAYASFASRMCINANCVVMCVNYRLAPEHPYPIAVEDAVESLQWVAEIAKVKLNIDMKRVAVGGTSSGGNLAAVLALKAATITPPLPHPLIFQVLIVPITDNTSTSDSPSPHASWKTNEHAPWLSPASMLGFRNNYLPNVAQRSEWTASPLLAPDEVLKAAPKCWLSVAELDILRDEALGYAEKLEAAGVDVTVVSYEKVPHPAVILDGAMTVARRAVQDAGDALRRAFWE